MHVSDYMVQRLREWGVKRIYGYPGDGINGIMGALNRAQSEGGPEFIQARHEEMAAFMACGHAKFTGEVGVCLATSGPGAIHLLNGLYDAKLDHQPVVAIVGQQARSALGGHYQQEVDLQSLFKDVAGAYVHTAMTAKQFPALIDRALRIAHTERTVTCVIVPADLQEETYAPPKHAFKHIPTTIGFAESRVLAPEADIQEAARILNEGKRVAILIGQGAKKAAKEVIEVADLLGAGVAKALLGKDALPDDLPFVTGSIGLLGTIPSDDMMMSCDTLLMVGSSLPYTQFLPRFGQARGVQIDIDARMIGIRYPMEAMLVGDSTETLRALIPLLRRKQDRSWRERIEASVARWWRLMEDRAHLDADPVNPQRYFSELSQRLPEGCIVTCDSGSAANWYARHLKFRAGMHGSLSGTLATMGSGVPYAFAAKMAYPERPVIACVGDGAFTMNGLNEMITIAKYWRRWSDPRLIVLVLHNNDLNQVTWEQRVMSGDPKFEASQVIPDVDYAAWAELLGLRGIRVEDPGHVAPAWDEALSCDRPVVLDGLADPEVPPLPPHIELEQAVGITTAMLTGEPDRAAVMRQTFKHKVQEFLTR